MHGEIIDSVFVKQEKERDCLRMGNGSWSINLDETKNKDINGFRYITENSVYEITKEDATKHGFERTFATEGKEETKLVVPKKYWRITGEHNAEH